MTAPLFCRMTLRLSDLRSVRPAFNLFTMLTETAGVGGLKIAETFPAGFGSGRGSVLANHGPQPASMRAAPAFRQRLSDFEATNTCSFSQHGE